MKNSILNLGNSLNKVEQKSINGGMILLNTCKNLCKTAKRGSRCFQDGYLAACDGRGGFIYF